MQTEALTSVKNLLAEIYIMCAAQKDNKSIDHDLIFKLNELLIQIDPILWEAEHNNRELEATGFSRYRSDLVRVFNNYLQSIDGLFPGLQVTAAELMPGGPDGFNIHQDYTVADVQQFLHDVFSHIDSVIDKEFSGQGTEIELPEFNTINEKLLLLKHTGIYEQIKTVCGNNKKRMSELIGAITGEKPGSIRTISSHLDTPHIRSRMSPYTMPSIDKTIILLTRLKLDITELVKISEKILQDKP